VCNQGLQAVKTRVFGIGVTSLPVYEMIILRMGFRMRVAVVGASSGLGRSIALGLARRGAQVAFLARRVDRLERAVAEANENGGSGCIAVGCDVTDAPSVGAAVEATVAGLGGLDALVYATAAMVVDDLADVSPARWAAQFATNVTGAAVITAHALPHLRAARGTAVYLSSVSASLTPPWAKIGAYVTSKAALDKLVEAWRWEHPDVGFTRLAVGDCAGGSGESATEFGRGEDRATFTAGLEDWLRRGYVSGDLIDADELAHVVDAVLRVGPSASVPVLAITPRAPRPTS
jgi:NAD(P)-dependent dehydrogenase (short-subunit alcohol dehydrogenase family)